MPLLVTASALRLGTATAVAAYLGTVRVWPAPPNASLLAATTPRPTAALVGSSSILGGVLAGTTPRPVGALVGTTALSGAVSGTAPMPAGALTGTMPIPGALAGVPPMPSGTLAGVTPLLGSLAAAAPKPVGALVGTVVTGSAETFGGTNGSAWPAPWTGASGTTVDQQSGAGRLLTDTPQYSQTFIRRTAPDDAEIAFRWQWQGPGSTVDIAIRGAGVNYGDNPKWACRLLPDAIWITGTAGLLANVSTTHTVNTWYWARIRWQGNAVSARTWADGGSEPGTWTATGTDATSPTSGYLIFRTENFAAGAATALFDDITITTLSGSGTSGALAATTPKPSGALTATAAGGGGGGFGTAAFGTAPFGA